MMAKVPVLKRRSTNTGENSSWLRSYMWLGKQLYHSEGVENKIWSPRVK